DLAELGEKLGLPFKEFQKGIPDRLDSVEAWHRLWQDVSTALSFSVQTRSTVPEQFAFSLFVVGAYRGLLEEVLAVLIESEVPQSGEFRVMRLAGEQESLEALALECAYNLFVEGRITGSDEAAVDAVNPSALFRTVGFLGEYFESTLRFLEESCP